MTFPYAELRSKLINHLIALEALDPEYAVWALEQARREPSGVYRTLLQDVLAEKARRAAALPADTSSPKEKAITTTTSSN